MIISLYHKQGTLSSPILLVEWMGWQKIRNSDWYGVNISWQSCLLGRSMGQSAVLCMFCL